jgi:hypothetical protein
MNNTGQAKLAMACKPWSSLLQAVKPRCNKLTSRLLAKTRRFKAVLAPCTQVPGPKADGGAAKVARENTLIMAMALSGSASDAANKGADTGMGKAVPIKAKWPRPSAPNTL